MEAFAPQKHELEIVREKFGTLLFRFQPGDLVGVVQKFDFVLEIQQLERDQSVALDRVALSVDIGIRQRNCRFCSAAAADGNLI